MAAGSFFPAVSMGPRWGPHSDTVHIALFVLVGPILCQSRIMKIYTSVYLLGLFLPKWIDIGLALSVCGGERAQVVLRKSWVLLGSYIYTILCTFSWCCKNLAVKTRYSMGVSLCGTISKNEHEIRGRNKMQSLKYRWCFPIIPLSSHPSRTTHKAIQMYNPTKEDLDSRERETLHYDLKINWRTESRGIRCRDQRDINTTAVQPWLLTICPAALGFEPDMFNKGNKIRGIKRWHMTLGIWKKSI